MSLTRPPYPSGFREQMVKLVRSGRSPEELTREVESNAAEPVVRYPLGTLRKLFGDYRRCVLSARMLGETN